MALSSLLDRWRAETDARDRHHGFSASIEAAEVDAMPDDLLENARRQAEKADPSVRAAALLRIARVESATDPSRARKTLLDGLSLVQELPRSVRTHFLQEARAVAAAVSPELLAEIPAGERGGLKRFASLNLIQIMLTHGHVDAAFDYISSQQPGSFPFMSVGGVLHGIDQQTREGAARRMALLRRAVEAWQQDPSHDDPHHHGHHEFVRLFGHFWKDFPPEEALAIVRRIVAEAAEEPDMGTSAGYGDGIHFTSQRQNTFFQILHVLRHLDPALAQSVIDSNDQLAAGVRRYPNGMQTMIEEGEAEAARRKADGATCGGGFIFAGDPKDFDRQRRLMDATRSGDFESSIEDAIEKYREDTSPATRNYAPKEYWPSTGAFRTLFYQAGKRLGPEAAELLERVPDDDLRLFASIELAAALAGVPASSIMHMKQPNPPGSPRSRGGRIVDAQMHREGTSSARMRSPDGRSIRCPKCLFQPAENLRWNCKCGHVWNTFWTSGLCPACHFQWKVTQCPHCGELSEHGAWYVSEP
jgi:hypothetical protein